MLSNSLFYVFSLGLVLFALGVVTARSAVYGVLSLVGAMCCMAGLFVLLKAFFVATVLVLVYAGAILVLFLFVVMLIDFRSLSMDWPAGRGTPIMAGALGLVFFVQVYKVIKTLGSPSVTPVPHGTAEALGTLLFEKHVLPFELTSFLILAAVVSVVVLAKRDAQ
jgi:NADH-quinone oxidoreductase subunit J